MAIASLSEKVLTCSVDGCDRPAKPKVGVCPLHYDRMRRGSPLNAPARLKRQPNEQCSFVGCDRSSYSKGLCGGHYQQAAAGKVLSPLRIKYERCQIESCDRPPLAGGLCTLHYSRKRSGISQNKPIRQIVRRTASPYKPIYGMSLFKCTTCYVEYPRTLEFFRTRKSSPDGLYARCRMCMRSERKDWLTRNPTQREKCKAATALWGANHRDERTAHARVYRMANPERVREYERSYQRKNYKTGSMFQLNRLISVRMAYSLRGGKRGRPWETLVGYTTEDLHRHLERQFTRSMSWNNMGQWHIDHIIPLSSFKFSNAEDPEFRAAWALTNLRPLWGDDNIKKSNKRLLLI